ncbi:MAG: hypothetical protein MZU97_25465 [Bacillus subtilis]|nr:hypothetical protein [Bacillus subtilis]
MIVSTSDLLNYLRCRRYAALDRNAALRTPGSEPQDDSQLATLSVQNNYQLANYEDDEQDYFDPEALHQDATAKALKRFRAFAQTTLQSRFPDRKHHLDLQLKVPFEAGLELKAKFDISLETHKETWYFSILPMTDGELQDQTFTVNQKKWPLFIQDADGMFRMHTILPSDAVASNYAERLAKLSDRHQDFGRHVYDQAFKAFVSSHLLRSKNAAVSVVSLQSRLRIRWPIRFGWTHLFWRTISDLRSHRTRGFDARYDSRGFVSFDQFD